VVRPRFALVLLCGTVAVAAWCAAGLGGFDRHRECRNVDLERRGATRRNDSGG
jgi:hypothetical protein